MNKENKRINNAIRGALGYQVIEDSQSEGDSEINRMIRELHKSDRMKLYNLLIKGRKGGKDNDVM